MDPERIDERKEPDSGPVRRDEVELWTEFSRGLMVDTEDVVPVAPEASDTSVAADVVVAFERTEPGSERRNEPCANE